MSRELRAITIATAVIWFVMLVTGVHQIFFYRPTASAAYADMEALRAEVTLGLIVRRAHQWFGWLALLAPIVGIVVALMQRGLRQSAPWVLLLPLTAAMILTGSLLPWDHFALWAVTAGTNMRGFTPLLGDDVRFVLLDGVEISPTTFYRWALLHIAVLPAITIATVAGATYWSIRRAVAGNLHLGS